MSMLHAHAVRQYCITMLHVHAAGPFYMYMLRAHLMYMYMLRAHFTCTCWKSMLHVHNPILHGHDSSPYSMSMICAYDACPVRMSLMHVHCCMSVLHMPFYQKTLISSQRYIIKHKFRIHFLTFSSKIINAHLKGMFPGCVICVYLIFKIIYV